LRIVCARCLPDAMKYTIKDLIVQNGRIFRTEGAFAIPFMDTPPINVVAKETAAAARGSEREYCFNFRLNAPPDEMWQEILRSQLGNFGVSYVAASVPFMNTTKGRAVKEEYGLCKLLVAP
jgi:hypothetical protein